MQNHKVMWNLEDWFRMLLQPASNTVDPWAGKAPILFPCVRTHVKNDGYITSDTAARKTGLGWKISDSWNWRLAKPHFSRECCAGCKIRWENCFGVSDRILGVPRYTVWESLAKGIEMEVCFYMSGFVLLFLIISLHFLLTEKARGIPFSSYTA
jgi:hypothetical protein